MNRFQHFPEKVELRKRKIFSVSVLSDLTLTPCRRAADFAADLDADVQVLQRPLRGGTAATQAVASILKKTQNWPDFTLGFLLRGVCL